MKLKFEIDNSQYDKRWSITVVFPGYCHTDDIVSDIEKLIEKHRTEYNKLKERTIYNFGLDYWNDNYERKN